MISNFRSSHVLIIVYSCSKLRSLVYSLNEVLILDTVCLRTHLNVIFRQYSPGTSHRQMNLRITKDLGVHIMSEGIAYL